MKKLLSLLLTLCLLIAVTVIPVPAMADSGEILFDFGEYGDTGSAVSHTIGEAIDYPELPANPDGELLWSLSSDTYEEPPVVLEDAYLQVYAVLLEGVFDFENHYQPTANMTSASGPRLTLDKDDGKGVMKFDNIAATQINPETGEIITSDVYSGPDEGVNRYNSIDIGEVAASAAKTYRITVAVKRFASELPLTLEAWTCARQLNFGRTRTTYDASVTIPAVDVDDTEYSEYTIVLTTPDNLVDNVSKNTAGVYGNHLFLQVRTDAAGTCVAYVDYIKVEEVVVADVTYNYADGEVVEETDVEVGSALKDLAANRLGENNGVWHTDEQGTTEAPAIVPEGGLEVYEVVNTGVFDFNNYYNYSDYTGTGNTFAVNYSAAIEVADGVLKYDSSKSAYNTTSITGQNRINSIAIGEAKENTTYKITVYYKRGASTNAISFTPLTGMKTLTGKATKVFYDSVSLSATETADSEYQKAEIVVTTAETFAENATYGGKSNCFYLTISTKVDGTLDGNTATLDIDKITVEEYKGSVTYVIPENATVNGENGEVTVDYYGDEAIDFPEVVYEDGYTFDAWKDAEGTVVTAPTLGGTYTLSVKEPVEMVTVKFSKGGIIDETLTKTVAKGEKITLPDTEFTDTSWWNHEDAKYESYFVGYEGEKVTVDADDIYYTTETYYNDLVDAGNMNIYRNWTGLDTTTGSSYLHKTETSADSSEWIYNQGSRVCTRLGVVEDGKTYRVSVTYKATTDADINFYMLTTNLVNSGAKMRNYLEKSKIFHTIDAGANELETTVTFYITADLPAKITESTNGLDDTKDFNISNNNCVGLYLTLGKEAGYHTVDLTIKETKVEDLGKVVTAKGASVLTDAAAEAAGSQAMRYYFDYATAGDGTTITIGETDYAVKERGFLYTNGAISHYAKYYEEVYYSYDVGTASSDFMMWLADAKKTPSKLTYKGVSGDKLANNWALENGIVTFSTYVTDIPEESYSAKMMVRGYVIFEADGVEHIVYSETINRSVQGIKDALGTGNNGEHEE